MSCIKIYLGGGVEESLRNVCVCVFLCMSVRFDYGSRSSSSSSAHRVRVRMSAILRRSAANEREC